MYSPPRVSIITRFNATRRLLYAGEEGEDIEVLSNFHRAEIFIEISSTDTRVVMSMDHGHYGYRKSWHVTSISWDKAIFRNPASNGLRVYYTFRRYDMYKYRGFDGWERDLLKRSCKTRVIDSTACGIRVSLFFNLAIRECMADR